MTQIDFLESLPRVPFQRHSPTSRRAAHAIAPAAPTLQSQVLTFIQRNRDGVTDEEIADGLRMGGSTARPRRVELVATGLVRDSGRTRKGRAGRQMTVWIAC